MTSPAPTYPPTTIWSVRRAPRNPIGFLQQLAAHGDLVPFSLGSHPAFLLNHPDYVDDVLVANHSRFSKPPAFQHSKDLLGTGLLTAEGELHRRRRRVVQPAFGSDQMERHAATIARIVVHASERWRDGTTLDIATEMFELTLTVIGEILFGTDLAPEATAVRRALSAASASIDPLFALLAPARRLRPARDDLQSLLDRLIAEHVTPTNAGDDVLSLLRRAEGSTGSAVSNQLRDDLLTLFVAGHDTIANGLVWTWQLLARHPEVETVLREELHVTLGGGPPAFRHLKDLTYAGWVLAEALRLYPPAWVLTRQALVDHEIAGTLVPAGAIVVLSQYLLQRDPRFFPDPLRFDPRRWDAAHERPRLAYFPFGAGPRSCIGQGLATMEGTLLLAGIAGRWHLDAISSIDCDARATLRPKGPVLMRLHRVSGK